MVSSTNSKLKSEIELAKEVKILAKEVNKLKDLEFMKVFSNPLRFMWFSLLKGMMVGLGTVLGASVLVALLVFILSKVSLVPVVGDFVKEILNQIQTESSISSTVPAAPAPPYTEPPVKVSQ